MNAGRRSTRQLASITGGPSASSSICTSCLITLSRRSYASAAAATTQEPSRQDHIPPVAEASSSQLAYQLRAGVLLSRPPVITRDLAPFEKSFFLYQRRLNERLALPFSRYFYFRKGTPADVDWKRKYKSRLTPARDIGKYDAYGEEGWNDELLVGNPTSEPEHQVEALLKDAEQPASGGAQTEGEETIKKRNIVEKPMPRVTEADQNNDQKSLNRLLQKNLYLLVKNGNDWWTLPTARLDGRESLHQAAERILVHAAGLNMNTWVVGNVPVGHYQHNHSKQVIDQERKVQELGEKTFYMKARIMGGQADLTQNKLGLKDFRWLSKEEVEGTVSKRYWAAIRNMFPDR